MTISMLVYGVTEIAEIGWGMYLNKNQSVTRPPKCKENYTIQCYGRQKPCVGWL